MWLMVFSTTGCGLPTPHSNHRNTVVRCEEEHDPAGALRRRWLNGNGERLFHEWDPNGDGLVDVVTHTRFKGAWVFEESWDREGSYSLSETHEHTLVARRFVWDQNHDGVPEVVLRPVRTRWDGQPQRIERIGPTTIVTTYRYDWWGRLVGWAEDHHDDGVIDETVTIEHRRGASSNIWTLMGMGWRTGYAIFTSMRWGGRFERRTRRHDGHAHSVRWTTYGDGGRTEEFSMSAAGYWQQIRWIYDGRGRLKRIIHERPEWRTTHVVDHVPCPPPPPAGHPR